MPGRVDSCDDGRIMGKARGIGYAPLPLAGLRAVLKSLRRSDLGEKAAVAAGVAAAGRGSNPVTLCVRQQPPPPTPPLKGEGS